MKIAIMQPYIFPYIGYFQLINAVDIFVFYDDVNFIKKGWINRNKILINKESHLFTTPLANASQNKLIKDIMLGYDEKWVNKFYKKIEFNYRKAPYFEAGFDIIKKVFDANCNNISELCIETVVQIANYLDISTSFKRSSLNSPNTLGLEKADRLIEISKINNADIYINPSGGKEIYQKKYFLSKGIKLLFIENRINPYKQFNSEFVEGLSIIDILMFNSKNQIKKMLNHYKLV